MATRRLVAIGIRNPEDCAAAPAFAFKEAQLRKAPLLASFLDQPVIFMPTRSYSWISPPRASGVASAPSPHRTYLVSSDRQAEQKARNSAAGQAVGQGYLVVGYRSRVASMPARTLGSKPASTCVAWASRTSLPNRRAST